MDNKEFEKLVLQRLETLSEGLGSLRQEVALLTEGQGSLRQEVVLLTKGQGSLHQEVAMLGKRQESLYQIVVMIEHEHGQKLDALFDGYRLLKETLDDHTERLERIEAQVAIHEVRIEILDKTKLDKSQTT